MFKLRTKSERAKLRIAVIGGGLGGIAAGVKLKKAGFDNFTIFEQSPGVGGVWHDNKYPGCECDIPSHFYSYSFMPYDWSRTHAKQPELLAYIEATVERFGLRPHIRLATRVDEVRWDEAEQLYRLRLDSGEMVEAHMVISAVGILNRPKDPAWPGLSDFSRAMFHSSRWNAQHDLKGKRVAVVGTGSTGAQLVGAIAPEVGHLFVFQREPGWVVPKPDRDYTPDERARYRNSRLYRLRARYRQYRAASQLLVSVRIVGTKGNTRFRKVALGHLQEVIADQTLRQALTPDFPFGCKRLVQSSDYIPTFARPNVTLVPHAVERLTKDAVVAANGVSYEVDVLIVCTGFHAQNFLGGLKVFGSGGQDLHKGIWRDSARAFMGVTVPGFPNFYILYGPNTNGGGSIIYQLERQADVAVRAAKRIRPGATSMDTRKSALDWFVKWVDRYNEKLLSATRHCHNYFYASDGRNVTQWPLPHLRYTVMLRLLMPLATRVRRRSGA